MKIPLSNSELFFEVDEEDYRRLSKFTWCLSVDGYPTAWTDRGSITAHRYLLSSDGFITDHKDGNILNCRRGNLRLCTPSQSAMNRKRHKNNKSGFKGVWFDKDRNKFSSYIVTEGKQKRVGRFKTAEEAARAYDEMAIKLHGEFANLNFARQQ